MGKYKGALSILAVKKIAKPGLHFVGGVPNLALHITKAGSRSWILRYRFGGRSRDMGLGPFPEVSLSQARDCALLKRELIRHAIDPIAERHSIKLQEAESRKGQIIFREAAEKYIAMQRNGWKNVKHADQWTSTLDRYVSPVFGNLQVRDIKVEHMLKVLEPIWTVKTETATRVRSRVELILDWAKVRGYREGDNPAAWKGNLDCLLPPPSRVAKVKHHKAMPWEICPHFFLRLSKGKSIGSNALRFCVLTACRTGEVRGAKWTEVDLEKGVWTIPAERMKAGREQRVPLSSQSQALLRSIPRLKDEGLIFPGSSGAMLSDMTLLKQLRDMGESATVHGFRSSFRDWAGEATNFPREVIEHALAHSLKDKAEAAYARGDLFRKRVALMQSWADFLISTA